MNYLKKSIALLALLLIAGCSSIFTTKDGVRYYYVLNPIPKIVSVNPAPVRLEVQMPSIPEWLSSKRIVLLRNKNQIDFYSRARWGANLSQMLGRIITESLTNNRVAKDIIYSDSEIQADYSLLVEVIAFQAEYNNDMQSGPIAHVQMQVKLLTGKEGRVIHQFSVENYVPATQNKLSAIITAFERSNQGCLEKIVENISRDLSLKH